MQGVDVPGYASIMVVVMFLGGVQLICLGFIGEYLGRLYVEAKGRPLYIIAGIETRADGGNATTRAKENGAVTDKIALVTGAGTGIGRATSLALLGAG